MDKIEELLTRGVANIIPNKQDLEKLLHSGKKLNIYLGIDPTSPHIHLGHAVLLRKLQKFIDLKQGHSITLLIGDFTALVGDTSDKESERPILTEEEIEKNFQTYKKQAEKILDFTQVKIRHNKEWLEKLIYKELLHLKQQFSLNDFISRELIRKRLDEGKRVRLDETEYPIMQGYDSYFMDTDIQIGGTDQTFNMQAGRTLQKNLRIKESFVITTEFLMGTDGRKMSKSWGNAIWLDDSADDIYRKVMAINDDLIIQYYTLATNIPLEEIENMKKTLEKDGHPMEQKKKLAFQIVSELHDKNAALKAAENFKKTVQQKEKPEEMKKIPFPYLSTLGKINILDLLYEKNITPSRAEAKRLIEQKGVKINNVTILYPDEKIETTKLPIIVQIGKRKFYSIEEK